MLGDHSSHIKLGSVIYGRVSGFPWWPAVVAKCPNTHQWMNGGKFWVYFFNDTAGAWLKDSQIRSFDRYNHDLCQEHNSSVAKFRRYQERINKAVSIAETHVSPSLKPLRVKVLPPKRSTILRAESRSDTASDEKVTNRQNGVTTVQRRYSKRKPPLTRKREPSIRTGGPPLVPSRSAENGNHTEAENTGVNEARPKRKRTRSIRYLEYDDQPESKAPQRLHGHPAPRRQSYPIVDSSDTAMQHISKKHDNDRPNALTEPQAPARRRSSRLRSSTDVPGASSPSAKQSRQERMKCYPHDSCKGKLGANTKSFSVESSASAGSVDLEGKSEKDEAAHPSNCQVGNKITRSKGRDETMMASGSLTKHMYLTELKRVAREPNGDVSWPTSSIKTVRGLRSFVGVQPHLARDVDALDECTDSEERPERERKVNNGSLEYAAEDLVECAIQGYGSNSSDPDRNTPEGHSIAFSNGDLVSSILNRLSNLEKDVRRLNERAASEEQATLGEDATAAGVKSAVEALAAASAAYAKARNYNVSVIRRSMEILWPNGQFPLTGADGDLLRTVAQSLILASCKRRQAEIAKLANGTHRGDTSVHQTEKRSPNVHSFVPTDGISRSAAEIDNCQYEKKKHRQIVRE